MEGLVLFLHILVSLLLIIVVLLQSGKAADLAGAFGGMGSQSTFGPRGAATFLSKMTTTLAVLFMVTSLSLYIIASNKGGGGQSVLGPEDVKQEQTVPAEGTEETKPGETGETTETSPEKAAEGETAPAKTEDANTPKTEEKKDETDSNK